jgi:NAD+ kinase
MKILIAAKQNQTGIRAARRLYNSLLKLGVDVQLDHSTAGKLRRFKRGGTSIKKFDGDLIITLGGDGTFLWAAYQAIKPILPVRIEGYGFLCTSDFKELLANLDRIVGKDYTLLPRMRLQCSKIKKAFLDKLLHSTYPLSINEIAFARKRPSKVLKLEYTIDDTTFSFWGDGVIFSTPCGSTAYASSAGSSLIDPSLETISIVPLYPFHSKIKPMIVPADKKITVRIHAGDCALIIDGHTGEYVREKTEFVIERGSPLIVASLKPYNFYSKFKETFLEGREE